jgi:hypothetical protein
MASSSMDFSFNPFISSFLLLSFIYCLFPLTNPQTATGFLTTTTTTTSTIMTQSTEEPFPDAAELNSTEAIDGVDISQCRCPPVLVVPASLANGWFKSPGFGSGAYCSRINCTLELEPRPNAVIFVDFGFFRTGFFFFVVVGNGISENLKKK